ncbi:MAG: DUF7507 domain-containing protein [Rhizobiaceae bacterium]
MKNRQEYPRIFTLKGGSASAVALFTALGAVTPAFAAIDNSAIAVGTFSTPDDTTSAPSAQSVPVIPAGRDLNVAKSVSAGPTIAAGVDPANTDAGDTITYLYIITNDGNVTETNVTPVDVGPTFNGTAGVNALGAFAEVAGGTGTAATLAPGETVHFEATYTFDQLDVLRAAGITNGVSNTATASSDDHTDTDTSTATATIGANPLVTIGKVAVLNDEITADGLAETGETITYTYTVTNAGNVPLTNVGVQDTHEGALVVPAPAGEDIGNVALFTDNGLVGDSSDATADDGVFDVLGPGDVAIFTYVHTVTQTEVDNQ